MPEYLVTALRAAEPGEAAREEERLRRCAEQHPDVRRWLKPVALDIRQAIAHQQVRRFAGTENPATANAWCEAGLARLLSYLDRWKATYAQLARLDQLFIAV